MASVIQDIEDNLITILGEISGLQQVEPYVESPETVIRPCIMVLLKGGTNENASDGNVNRKVEIHLVCIGVARKSTGLSAKEVMSRAVAKLYEDDAHRTINGTVHQLTQADWESLPHTKDRPYSAEVPKFFAKLTTPEGVI